ncbi:NAD-dependent epimerase/dehydratase terH [Colletotrichum sp. SAR11_59]|uniref:Aldehyde reductase II n=1 Tax=Colletotrichum asianum TaxID=702518 RepID=A0A8H3ZMN5_9PEZI|nr:aldehyde reductase II [Colletotrichum asianum]KAI8298105.1 NAD-dependent epimerase/dehydratase terH [Colletotrichum sp. SAR11_59]
MVSSNLLDLPQTALPIGSLVVVSGASGCMGSHICDQLLGLGFRVRGISRNVKKSGWIETMFTKTYGPGKFELIEVPNFSTPGAFNAAIKGAHGVVHTAADTSPDLNPDNVVSPMVSDAIGIAEAAASTPSCSRLVYTSSSSAVADPAPGIVRKVTNATYNEETVIAAYSPDLRQDLVGGHTVYAAGKVKTEQALWKWYHSRAPNLVMNTVIPSPCYGEVLYPKNQGFTAAMGVLKMLWDGNGPEEIVKMFESQWFCDVKDVASLHVGALLLPQVKSERLFAYAGRYTVNDFLRIFKTAYPSREFPEDVENMIEDATQVPNERSTEVLKLLGLKGWKSLQECLESVTKQFVEASG